MIHLALRHLRWITIFLLFSQAKSFAQPKAEFTATPVSGCAPIVVRFTDQSTGNPTQWRWDLGNGVISFLQNPSTTYFNPGSYNIKLVVRNASGADSIIKNQYITVYPNPVINFTASDTTGCFPLPVQFTDQTTTSGGTLTKWEWDFGDGVISSQQNPAHTYISAGDFSVTLRVTNSFGCVKTFSRPQYIRITDGVKAGFTNTSPGECKAPATVTFTNTSTGPGTLTYSWDFGDGGTSTDTNPVHTYTSSGSYTVMLVAVSPQGCRDTIRKENLISIGTLNSQFSSPASVCEGEVFTLTNTSTPAPGSVVWYFGDGSTSTDINPTKSYAASGIYTIKLVNNFGSCADSVSKTITVKPVPRADFSANQTTSCKVPFTVNFTNLTPGSNTYSWNFGDGGTSTDINPAHTYTAAGAYTVTLIAVNANGCSDTIEKQQYITIQRPTVTINGFPRTGCVPTTVTPTATVTSSEPVASYLWNFGDGGSSTDANPTYTYTAAGTYDVSLTITTTSGCTETVVFPAAVRLGNKPDANFSVNPTDVCAFQPVQFTDLTTGNPDQWLWFFGDGTSSSEQNPLHAYQDTGWFSVTLVVWNNTCADTIRIQDAVHIRPPIAIFTIARSCTDKYKIDFTDHSLGATSWQWDFGDGTTSTTQHPSHTYSATGSYTVRLTVSNGTCTHFRQETVVIIDEKAEFIADRPFVCKGTPVTFTSNNINAANISAWAWDFGDGSTSADAGATQHTYASPGTYAITLTITDVLGCSSSKTINVTVYGPSAQFSPNVSGACLGNSNITFNDASTTDGTNAIVKWIWNYGDGTVDSTDTPPYTHLYTAPGEYNVSLTIVDNFGCRDNITKPTSVIIAQPKAAFISPDTLSCTDKPVQFVNQSQGYDLQYQWTFGDGSNGTDVNPVHYYSAVGLYDVSLVVTDRYGCRDSINKPAYINITFPNAAFTVSDSMSSCPPLLVNFTNASTNYVSLQWDFGDGNTSPLENPSHYYTTPGVFYARLIAISAGGCTDTAFQRIEVRGPRGSFTYAPLLGCNPLTVTFTATTLDRISFIWDYSDGEVNATTDSVVTHTYTAAGEYIPKMILIDASGCTVPIIGTDTIKVVGIDTRFDLSQVKLCDSGYVNFTNSTVSNDFITGYEWNFGDGTTSNDPNPSHHYTQPGFYDIQLVVTTGIGCRDTAILSDTVKVFESPVIQILGDSVACEPAQFTFSGNIIRGNPDSLRWQWNFGNGQTDTLQNPPAQSYPNAGSYTVTANVTDHVGCTDDAEKSVTVHPLPATNAGPDTRICRDDSIQLHATGAATYAWNPSPSLSCTSCADPYASPTDSTLYIVAGTTEFGCTRSDSVIITVRQRFTMTVGPGDSICAGTTITLSASGADKYSWSPATGLDNPTSPTPKATPPVTTLYTVSGMDNDNCFTEKGTVFVHVTPIPSVDAGADQTIAIGSEAQLQAINSSDVITWRWTPGATLSCTDCPDPKARPKQSTRYFVEVRNSGGCASVDNMTVYVVCDKGNLFLPNTFSPNGDGMNDRFYPRGSGIGTIRSLMVFNRWGELVFERTNFNANDASAGWDGTYKGQKLSPDVYVYSCDIVCQNGQVLTFKGDITLLK